MARSATTSARAVDLRCTIGATFAFDYLDIRWLRTGRPDAADWMIFAWVGPAVALLVAVLVLIYGLGLDFAPVLDLALSHYRVVLVATFVVVWTLRAIGEHHFSN